MNIFLKMLISNVYYLLLTLFSLTACAGSLSAETLKISFSCEDVGIPPFIMGNGSDINWEKPGVSIEVLKSLETKLPVKISFARVPWKRALEEIKNNRADGIFHASFKPERMELGVYPMKDGGADPDKRMATLSYVLYKLKHSPLQWDGKTLSNISGPVGVIMGYSIGEDVRKMGAEVVELYTPLQSMKMLSRGRIAGVADLEKTGDAVLKQSPDDFGSIIKLNPPLKETAYYLMLSHKFVKENREIAMAIWDETEKIRDSEAYEKLFEKYLD